MIVDSTGFWKVITEGIKKLIEAILKILGVG